MFVNVNVQQAQELVKRGVIIVDVRNPDEWARGHIANARLVSLSTVRMATRESLPKKNVLFVCAGGTRSQLAARLAREAGITNVYNLIGGTSAWQSAGLPLTRELGVAV